MIKNVFGKNVFLNSNKLNFLIFYKKCKELKLSQYFVDEDVLEPIQHITFLGFIIG